MDKAIPTIVVAKYKEDLSWVDSVDKEKFDVVVYDKSEGGSLPNVGRESHTFLHHICENYYKLSDITIFTQGDPFPHSRAFLEKISKLKNLDKYLSLSDTVFEYPPEFLIACPPKDPESKTLEYFQTKYGLEVKTLRFGYGAIMAVPKEVILKRQLSFYEMLRDYTAECIDDAAAMEALWPQVFYDETNSSSL